MTAGFGLEQLIFSCCTQGATGQGRLGPRASPVAVRAGGGAMAGPGCACALVQCDYGELLGKAAIFLTEIFKGTGWREQLLTVKQFLLGDLNPGYCMEELSVSSAGDEWV